jgi:hypothetical protein
MSEIIEVGDADESSDMQLAQRVGEALCRMYPDHPWLVSVQGRALVIRHLAIGQVVHEKIGREGFGAVLKPDDMRTHRQTVHMAMEFGGQLLEAFGLPRGRWDGSHPTVPKEWKRKQESFH